jgi:hypothetical protein
MISYAMAGVNPDEVADACWMAARSVESHPGRTGVADEGKLSPAVADLLQAVSRALALDRTSVPEDVQRAALRVARQVEARVGEPTSGREQDRDGRSEARPNTGWGAVRGETVPFAASIRLGRMG